MPIKVGVSVILTHHCHPNAILVGVRKGSHGAGKLAAPGGHLELGESFQECARREVKEETDLDINVVKQLCVTNDVAIDGDPEKHYVTLFSHSHVYDRFDYTKLMEPNKCEGWTWMSTDELHNIYLTNPESLFDPLRRFIEEYIVNKTCNLCFQNDFVKTHWVTPKSA